jgi:hypothetical protein
MFCFLVLTLEIFFIFPEVSCDIQKEPVECRGTLQKTILDSMSGCSICPTLIDLRSMFSNNSDVIQAVPDHITVDKCGGSCYILHIVAMLPGRPRWRCRWCWCCPSGHMGSMRHSAQKWKWRFIISVSVGVRFSLNSVFQIFRTIINHLAGLYTIW